MVTRDQVYVIECGVHGWTFCAVGLLEGTHNRSICAAESVFNTINAFAD